MREDNREYFFGLINRDLSFKPSLMAYCNISEALDGARFKGWIKFSENNPFSKGIMFDTPKGPMSIIWDRRYTSTSQWEQFSGTLDQFMEYTNGTDFALQRRKHYGIECHRTKRINPGERP